MTDAETRYRLADLQHRVARARLLLQLAAEDRDPPASLADLLTFARQLGDDTAADSVPAFRAAVTAGLRAAQDDLDRLSI